LSLEIFNGGLESHGIKSKPFAAEEMDARKILKKYRIRTIMIAAQL
jgi:hypothetical protein